MIKYPRQRGGNGFNRGAMEIGRTDFAEGREKYKMSRASLAGCKGDTQWGIMGFAYGGSVERYATALSPVSDLPSAISEVVPERLVCFSFAGIGNGPGEAGQVGFIRMFYRWFLQRSQKRGACVGPTKRGKGSKIMAIADRAGLPVSINMASASPAEVRLVESTLDECFTRKKPKRLIGDKAYDSDPLDKQLRIRKIDLIAPHKRNRKREQTQDGRALRRYCRRWKIERLFAWLHQFRRLVVRYEYHAVNYLGLLQLACIVILLRNYL